MKHFFILILLSLVVSCGTLKKRDNIVFADSSPRGLEVKDEKGKVLGKTPFFLEVDTFKRQTYSFFSEEEKTNVSYGCPFDWGGSIIPDLIFVFQPVISATFLITDLLTGGAYVCRKPIHATMKVDESKVKLIQRNRRILVLPIASRDKVLSDKIIKSWEKTRFRKLKKDEELVWNESTESSFFVRGLDHYADTHPDRIRRRFLNEVGLEFNATHFLHFDLEKDKKKKLIKVTPVLYDAFTLAPVEADYLKPFKVRDTEYDSYGFLARVVDFLHILPNSIRGGFSAVAAEKRQPDKNTEYKVERHPDQLNQLITFFGFDSVHHPRFFDSWDLAGFLSPSLGSSSFKSTQNLSSGQYEVLLESYYIDYNASFRVFTPFGQIGTGFGLGLMGFIFSDNRNLEYSSTTAYTHYFFDYTYFFSDRWFFKLAYDFYQPTKGKIHSDYYDLISWKEASVRVGYYFPEIKSITRKLLPF
ncbi:MAG: hypothetical protein EP326_05655 [Deltaproteobacteria bacterium]|nr:MAG: hypothetical protein EP326_05655 [Deltaproteobacteria bacterium]